jgi:glutamate-5-semialdehyde dehydrogenase
MEPTAEVKELVYDKLKKAKAASIILAQMPTVEKNAVLLKMADALEKNSAEILLANAKDLAASGLNESLKDRLMLN